MITSVFPDLVQYFLDDASGKQTSNTMSFGTKRTPPMQSNTMQSNTFDKGLQVYVFGGLSCDSRMNLQPKQQQQSLRVLGTFHFGAICIYKRKKEIHAKATYSFDLAVLQICRKHGKQN